MNWLRKLFGLCQHHWDTQGSVPVYSDPSDAMPIGRKFLLKCSKCGALKTFKDY